MHTMIAYYQSVDPGNAYAEINAVQDQHVTISGADVYVPEGMNHIIGAAVLVNDASLARARLRTPSINQRHQMNIEPLVQGLVFGSPPEMIPDPYDPAVMDVGEALNLDILSDPAAAAVHQGLVILADGPIQPVSGAVMRVRATSAVALAAGTWVNGNITFEQDLPIGTYRVVGLRARGTNLVAVRLVFVGGKWRPGAPAVNVITDRDERMFRNGMLGVWGEFHSLQPPTVDCLGVTDTAQTYILDIIRV